MACHDERVHLWDAATCKTIGQPLVQGYSLNKAIWSPSGCFVATTNSDTYRVWQVNKPKVVPPATVSSGLPFVDQTAGQPATLRLQEWIEHAQWGRPPMGVETSFRRGMLHVSVNPYRCQATVA